MVKETTPFPSGGYAPNQKRRTKRSNTSKERRPKTSRRPTYQQWLFSEMPRMVDRLCQKMYENEFRNGYASRDEFCREFADLVVDQRRVKGPVERANLLERVLSIAEANGRVDISGTRRKLSIFLSDKEWKQQRKQAKTRGNKSREKWEARRRRKAA